MNLYRGYVPTKDKAPQKKFKSGQELMTLEQVQDYSEFAGVLDVNTILIDVDDCEQSEILMKIVDELQLDCKVLQTTRGRHFLFRNTEVKQCYTHTKTACGLTVDVKVGCKNSTEVLKFNGEDRFCEWDIEEGGDYQELPVWLLPVKTDIDLFGLKSGDGRNNDLFRYELVLKDKLGMNYEQACETIRIINKYILKEPLSESELDVILREEAFGKPVFFQGKTFLHDKFGQHMMHEFHVKRINGQLHVYKDGIYVSGYRNIENMMQSVIPSLKSNQRSEVMKYLEIMNPDSVQNVSSENLIPFKNGVLNIRTMERLPFSSEYIIMNKIPWNWNPDAYSDVADHTLNRISCDNPEIRKLLEELIGYCFYRRNNLQKSFILTGTGSNGKSTFLEVLRTILGRENCSELDIGELDDKFSTVTMTGKLANIGDDISSDFLEGKTLSVFKKAVTGNEIKAENKGQDVFFFKPYCKLLFSANEIPRMKSRGFSAIKRRIIIVPFNAVFTKEDPDFNSYIEDDLKEEQSIEYLIRLGVEGLKRALEQKDFTESKEVQEELEQFEKENNPILGWLDEMEDEDHLTREELSLLYHEYCIFCDNGGFKPLSREVFSKQLQKEKRLESFRRVVNGKKVTMFRKV